MSEFFISVILYEYITIKWKQKQWIWEKYSLQNSEDEIGKKCQFQQTHLSIFVFFYNRH